MIQHWAWMDLAAALAAANKNNYCVDMNFPAEQQLRYAPLVAAANSNAKVGGLTHSFYRYPARFGETFVREAIENF
jgi:hypothetical protein